MIIYTIPAIFSTNIVKEDFQQVLN